MTASIWRGLGIGALALLLAACSSGSGSVARDASGPADAADGSAPADAADGGTQTADAGDASTSVDAGDGGAQREECSEYSATLSSSKPRIVDTSASREQVAELVEDNTAFAFSLYRVLAQEPRNFVFSPLRISTTLAMTLAGARGQTADEIARTAHFTLPSSELDPTMDQLELDLMTTPGHDLGFQLDASYPLWVQQGDAYKTPFLDTLAAYYGAGLRVVDFAGAPGNAAQEIDRCAPVGPGMITPSTRFIVADDVHFHARWRWHPFNPDETRPGDFHLADGTVKQVSMLHGKAIARYIATDTFQAVDIPYVDASLLLIVPRGNFADFAAQFNATELGLIVALEKTHLVTLTLPKFSFTSSIDLANVLPELGMRRAFTDQADFSGITHDSGFHLRFAGHTASMSVDENGTDSPWVSGGGLPGGNLPPPESKLVVDRPFLFVVHGGTLPNRTGAVILAGQVVDP